MAKLTDLQLVLLSTAASRTDGSLLPPAASVAAQTGRIAQAITTLIKRGLAFETAVTNTAIAYRNEGEDHFGAVITDVGREGVGMPTAGKDDREVSDVRPDQAAGNVPAPCVEVVTSRQAKAGTKQALLVGRGV